MDGVIGGSREAGERIVKISQRIESPVTTGFHDGVENRSFLSSFRCPDEQDVLSSNGGGADGILDDSIVVFHREHF